MLLEHERYYGLGIDARRPPMLLEHERYYGLGMHALGPICCWSTNVIMVWAWLLLFSDAVESWAAGGNAGLARSKCTQKFGVTCGWRARP